MCRDCVDGLRSLALQTDRFRPTTSRSGRCDKWLLGLGSFKKAIGSSRPAAMINWPTIQIQRVENRCSKAEARIVERKAARPKTGQLHPNTSGDATNSRAISGR